jgi:hypothetical protein
MYGFKQIFIVKRLSEECRDAIFTHPTAAEGLVYLLASVPAKAQQQWEDVSTNEYNEYRGGLRYLAKMSKMAIS